MTNATSKTCAKCGEHKSLDAFHRDAQKPDGRSPRCRPCRAAGNRVWAVSEAGRESLRAAERRYYAKNRAEIAEKARLLRLVQPEGEAGDRQRWRGANPGADKKYYEANRGAAFARVGRRRAMQAGVTFGAVDTDALWLESAGSCPLCNEPMDQSLRWPLPLSTSLDHIVPLSKGGTHEQANLQWTHLVCNIRKGAKSPTSTP
jgi:5-methylcytosine-specific restriction endonuclease McrA